MVGVVLAVAVAAAAALAVKQLLQRPRPRRRGSGLPSPVLKLAWQRMHTYIFELDIIGFTPGSAWGRAAVYSACVWRSLGPEAALLVGLAVVVVLVVVVVAGLVEAGVRRVFMAGRGRLGGRFVAKPLLSNEITALVSGLPSGP